MKPTRTCLQCADFKRPAPLQLGSCSRNPIQRRGTCGCCASFRDPQTSLLGAETRKQA